MPVTMPDHRMILAPVFLLAQALLVHWAAGRERAPAPPALASFPSQLGEWRQLREDPITADVAGERGCRLIRSLVPIAARRGQPASLAESVPAGCGLDACCHRRDYARHRSRSDHGQPIYRRQPWAARCGSVLVSGAAPRHGWRV